MGILWIAVLWAYIADCLVVLVQNSFAAYDMLLATYLEIGLVCNVVYEV